MEFRNLRTFQAVARHLSFHRAAEVLNYAQSTVSAQVQALEDELGVRLFDRLGRRVYLTEEGELLFAYAQKILDLEQEAQAEVAFREATPGSLVIRVPESLCVYRFPPVIRRFRSLRPNVRLQFITCAQEGLEKDLRRGITDLAFLLADSIQAGDLNVEILGTEALVLAASPQHPLASKAEVHTRDLNGETILLTKVDCSYRRILQDLLTEAKAQAGMILEFHSVEAVKHCVEEGLGVTMLPEMAAQDGGASNGLKILPWAENGLETAVLMVWHREKWLSPSMKSFMDAAREEIHNSDGGRRA